MRRYLSIGLRMGFPALLVVLASCDDQKKMSSTPDESKGGSSGKTASGQSSGLQKALNRALTETRSRDELAASVQSAVMVLDGDRLDDVFELISAGCPPGASASGWHLAVNEMIKALRQRELPGLTDALIDLAKDDAAGEVVRDYAVQHLFSCHEQQVLKISSDGRAEAIEEVEAGAVGLVRQFEPHSTALGTTLMCYASFSEHVAGDPLTRTGSDMDGILSQMIKNRGDYSTANQVAAVQTAARTGVAEAGGLILEIIGKENESASLRMSAIAALRYYPELIDEQQLTEVARKNKRLKYAVAALLDVDRS